MLDKQIALLRKQIEKLDEKNFDLQAWKKHTIILLESIFGSDSQKVKQIENIEYEYNSWSLRDTSGFSAYLDSCKKLGREVLEASVEQLEIGGVPGQSKDEPGKIKISIILDALDDELKGSQYRALLNLLRANISPDEKSRQLTDIIKELNGETRLGILKGILMHPDFVLALPKG